MRILSIDGGGVRGLIPAMILNYIENKTGQPIWRLFDLIVGTSTGGLITLLLTAPDEYGYNKYSTDDVVEFYMGGEAKKIHKPFLIPFIHGYKYASKNFNQIVTSKFQDSILLDALTDVLITSYDVVGNQALFFDNKKYGNLRFSDVARATSAAPTYFQPYPLKDFVCVDGGIYANNPAMCAYAEALKTVKHNDIMLVSLGTGSVSKPLSYNKIKNWYPVQWAKPLIDCMMDGIDDTVSYQLNKIMDADKYFRFQIPLDGTSVTKLDNASEENMNNLYSITKGYIQQNWITRLDELCDVLIT